MAEIPDLLRSLIDELDRKGALLLELRQQLTPQRRQEVEKRLRGLARKLCFSFDARIDQVAGFAGIPRALTPAQDGKCFGKLPVWKAKEVVQQLQAVQLWELYRGKVEERVDNTQGRLLACCSIAAYTPRVWVSVVLTIGIAIFSGLVSWYSSNNSIAQGAAIAVAVLTLCAGVAAAVAASKAESALASSKSQRERDIKGLETRAQQAGALAAELQSLGLRRSQQLVTAMQAELRSAKWQVQHALACVQLKQRGGRARARAAAAGP